MRPRRFTTRHRDAPEAIIEILAFWTSEYLEIKLEKIRRAALDNLVLVVYRSLDAGGAASAAIDVATDAQWCGLRRSRGSVRESGAEGAQLTFALLVFAIAHERWSGAPPRRA